MFDMIKKLQEAQKQMQEIKTRLDNVSVEGVSSDGKIKVITNGNRKIKSVLIQDESILGDKPALELQIVDAVNEAIHNADKVNESEMKSAAGSLIPGIGGLFK